jgi:hypothetical protein
MTTFSFVFRDGHLDLRIEHRGVERFVTMRYQVRASEWDAAAGDLKIGGHSARSRRLAEYRRSIKRDLWLLRNAVRGSQITADEIASEYRKMVAGYQTLGNYALALAKELAHENRPRTARGYLTATRRFVDFNDGYDMRHEDLTAHTIARFERALERDGLTPNTISFYIRTLHAVYNRAIAECIIPARLDDPFEDAHTRCELLLEPEMAMA